MTAEQIKESLSKDVVSLIAHQSGLKVNDVKIDFGIDFKLIKVDTYTYGNNIRYIDGGYSLLIQLKSTTRKQVKIENGTVFYDLKVKNYNDLIYYQKKDDIFKLILILVIFPDNQQPVEVLNQKIETSCQLYWYYPTKEDEMTKNRSSIRIKIPVKNKFDSQTLNDLFNSFYNT